MPNLAQMDGGEDSDDEMPLTIDEPDKAPKCSKKRKKDQIKPPKSSKKSRSDFLNTSSNSNSSTSSRQPLVIDENQSDTGDFSLLCFKNIHFMLILCFWHSFSMILNESPNGPHICFGIGQKIMKFYLFL